MAVVRKKYKENYTRLHNDAINDPKLSLKAKGLLLFMFSKPDNWNFSINGLKSQLKEGRDAIANILKELETFKYLVRTEIRTKEGKFIDIQYNLYEEPYTDNPITENPYTDNPTEDIKEEDIKELSKEDKEREVKTSDPRQLDLEVESIKMLKEEKEKKVALKKRKRFEVPEVKEIYIHMMEKSNNLQLSRLEAEKFFNYYESVGWYVGKKKMVNWKAAATNWLKRAKEFTKEKPKSTLQSNLDNANSVLQDAEERVKQLNNEIERGI